MERLAGPERDRLRSVLIRAAPESQPKEAAWVIARAEETGALAAVRARCSELGAEAREVLRNLAPSPQRALLEALTRYLNVERDS